MLGTAEESSRQSERSGRVVGTGNSRRVSPTSILVLKDGEYWEVEAEWPDGTIEPVYKFKAGLEALNWVKTESAAWVAERVAMASQ